MGRDGLGYQSDLVISPGRQVIRSGRSPRQTTSLPRAAADQRLVRPLRSVTLTLVSSDRRMLLPRAQIKLF